MVATLVLLETQVATDVMSCRVVQVVASALSCCVSPTRMLRGFGVTAMEMMQLTVTVRVVCPLTDGFCVEVAVIVAVPRLDAVANPEALIVATGGVEPELGVLLQVTGGLLWLPSSKVPEAVNCTVLFVVPV